MALSRGGKDRLATTAGFVLEAIMSSGPALPPTADGTGMKIETSPSGHVGKLGEFVK
jgi:hypothetical protein